MRPPDPNFPSLPDVSDAERSTQTDKQKFDRHVLEVREAAKMFDAMQAVGMDPFEAAERTPMAYLNRRGARQSALREMYQQEHRSEALPPAAE
jgi:hypothetical protein